MAALGLTYKFQLAIHIDHKATYDVVDQNEQVTGDCSKIFYSQTLIVIDQS